MTWFKVLLLKLGFWGQSGADSPHKKRHRPSEEETKERKKIHEKESKQWLFQQSWKVSHEWLMCDGKNNMRLRKWRHKHSLGANHKLVLATLSMTQWLLMRRAAYCVILCVCVCVCACVCVSDCQSVCTVIQFVTIGM